MTQHREGLFYSKENSKLTSSEPLMNRDTSSRLVLDTERAVMLGNANKLPKLPGYLYDGWEC